MKRLTALSLLAFATACAPTVEAPGASPRLGPVDLSSPVSALGTEPFWSVDLEGRRMIYKDTEGPDQIAPQPAPVMSDGQAVYSATTAGGEMLTVTLRIDESCSDGMSDRFYPLEAVVQMGQRRVQGCAASTHALRNGPESGQVQP